ncbi:MAG: hypothetical protein RQ745_00040 [Longimicrobiales bacterium]|nr:hypothetical protein [Longimicrobiales bacterium]
MLPPRIFPLALLLLVGACAGMAPESNPFDPPDPRTERGGADVTYTLHVTNPSFDEVEIFVWNSIGGQRQRIGRVGGSQERTFEFSMAGAVRDVRFELDYTAGPTCVTQRLLLEPGEVLEFNLPTDPEYEYGCR